MDLLAKVDKEPTVSPVMTMTGTLVGLYPFPSPGLTSPCYRSVFVIRTPPPQSPVVTAVASDQCDLGNTDLYQCPAPGPSRDMRGVAVAGVGGAPQVSTEEARELYEAQRAEICSLSLPPARELREAHKEMWIR